MNTHLLNSRVRQLAGEGVGFPQISERLGITEVAAERLANRTAPPRKVSCARCDAPLSFLTAVRVSGTDFCVRCHEVLFDDFELAKREFPALFGEDNDGVLR